MKKINPLKIHSLFLFSLTFTSLNYFNPAFSKDLQITDESYFLNLKKQVDLLEKKQSIQDKLNLADLYKNLGQDDKAINILSSLLNDKTNKNIDAVRFKLSLLMDRNFRFNESENLLKQISKSSTDYQQSIINLMKVYILKKDKLKAESLLKDNSQNLLLSAIYDYSVFSLNPRSSQEKLEQYLKLNPKNKDAKYYLASIMVDNHQLAKAKELLTSIIADDYFYSPAHSLLGFTEAIDIKKAGAGVNELKIAIRTNPMEVRALISYGNGTTDTDYEIIEKNKPNLKSSEYFFNENKEIIRLLNQNKIKEAEDKLNQLANKYPDNIHSYISKGNFYINTGEYDKAIEAYKKAREISPEYGLANNGLSIAIKFLIKSQEQKLKDFNLDTYDYSKLDINSLKKVFVNYDDLPEKYKKVIFYSVYPVRQYLPVLAASGSTHYIIPLYEKATDYINGQPYKNQRSFDGRLWDDIRGRGGFHSATGIEDLETSTYFDFNTLSHEFAHQIHGFAFTRQQKSMIAQLYEKAKKDDKFLDYYAGSNDAEYFAQGVEAYNSTQGKLTLKATAKNTIEFLKSKDKDLYDFVEQVSEKPVTEDNYSQAYLQAASDAYFNNDYTKSIFNYEKAVEAKPSDINNYLLLANVYYQSGQTDKSIDTYKKVLDSDKNSSYAYFGLAYNFSILGQFNEAQNNFDKGFENDKLSAEAYAELAKLFLDNNNYSKSQEFIDKSIKVESDNALAYSVKALYESEKFNFEDSIINIDRAISLDPGNILYKIRKTYILTKSGAIIKAYGLIKEADEMYKNSLPVKYGYDDKKNKYYYSNIKDIPTMAEYYYTNGYLKESEKNYSEAVNSYIDSFNLLRGYYKPKRKLLELYNSNLINKDNKEKIKSILKI